MDKEVIALTFLQGIHSGLAHGFILRAVLDRQALTNSGMFKASVTLQGLGCKEKKHEVGLSVDYQILVRAPPGTSGEGISPKYSY